jgi:hypothetical protein
MTTGALWGQVISYAAPQVRHIRLVVKTALPFFSSTQKPSRRFLGIWAAADGCSVLFGICFNHLSSALTVIGRATDRFVHRITVPASKRATYCGGAVSSRT